MLYLLMLLSMFSSGPKLTVYPHFATEPSNVILLLTDIPAKSGIACFALDGDNYYGGCQFIDGRRSIRIEYKDVLKGTYAAVATIDDKIVSEQLVRILGVGEDELPAGDFLTEPGDTFMDEAWDGRDELVKRRFKNDSLVAKPEAADVMISKYTDPWRPAYYSQFDDIRISQVYQESCVEGIHGLSTWIVPVKEAVKVTGGYEQQRIGVMEITSVPDYETGEYDIAIKLLEPWED